MNLGLTGGKYLIKIILGIKIEIRIFLISNVPNFKIVGIFNFGTYLGLVLAGCKYFIKITFDIIWEINTWL